MGAVHSIREEDAKVSPQLSRNEMFSRHVPGFPAAAAPAPRAEPRSPAVRRPCPAQPGPARPRSHRQAEPEGRGPDRAAASARTRPEGHPPHIARLERRSLLKKRGGKKPQMPQGLPLQSFLSVSSQLPFKAEPRPPNANSKSV